MLKANIEIIMFQWLKFNEVQIAEHRSKSECLEELHKDYKKLLHNNLTWSDVGKLEWKINSSLDNIR